MFVEWFYKNQKILAFTKNYLQQLQNENLSFIYVMFLERWFKIILDILLNIQTKTSKILNISAFLRASNFAI